MITAEQIKAARALLRLEQDELARRAGVSVSTIRRVEAVSGGLVAEATIGAVQQALEEAGVEFIQEGVMRKTQDARDPNALFLRLRAIAERSAAQAGVSMSEADLYDDDGLPR
jgi:transcriptional regulator with XRE-family HTH domain